VLLAAFVGLWFVFPYMRRRAAGDEGT